MDVDAIEAGSAGRRRSSLVVGIVARRCHEQTGARDQDGRSCECNGDRRGPREQRQCDAEDDLAAMLGLGEKRVHGGAHGAGGAAVDPDHAGGTNDRMGDAGDDERAGDRGGGVGRVREQEKAQETDGAPSPRRPHQRFPFWNRFEPSGSSGAPWAGRSRALVGSSVPTPLRRR
jgi:hypothetical protein